MSYAVDLVLCHSLFDRSTWERRKARPGRPLLDYLPDGWAENPTLEVILDGVSVPKEERQKEAEPGRQLLAYVLPGLEAFVLPALIVLITSAIVTGITYGIAALTAPRKGSEHSQEDSPTYGFDGVANTVRPGTRIPMIYGRHKFGGQLIQQFIRPQRDRADTPAEPRAGELHTLLGLGLGPIAAVEQIKINDSPAEEFGIPQPEVRLGAARQAAISGFRDVVTAATKDVLITHIGGPVQFTTQGPIDAFQLIFRFSGGLYQVTRHANFVQNQVDILVEFREVGQPVWRSGGKMRVTASIAASFDSFYDSPRLSRAQYEIQITRVTDDSDKATTFSEFRLVTINDVIEDVFTYPNTALLAIRQLPTNRVQGSPPEYTCVVRGRVVRVFTAPGVYTEAWSDNPAWCLLDLLTNKLAGLGAWIDDSRIDIESFIDWAAECDELVPKDTSGELEKQWTCNLVVDGSLTAMETIRQICTAGRAFFILKGNKWAVKPDRAEAAVQTITMGRIQKGQFGVLKTSKEDLANYLIGQYWNEDLDWEPDPLPQDDETLDASEDQRVQAVNLVGITTTSRARRLLAYLSLSNRLSRRTIELEVGREALVMEAGDVFQVTHDVPAWSGYSGMLREVDPIVGGWVLLDREITIEGGKSYELTVIHPDDTVETQAVTNSLLGTTSRITVGAGWSMIPAAGDHYAFGEVGQSLKKYRCTAISSGTAPWRRKIRAKEYDERVYQDNLTALPAPVVSKLPNPNAIPPDVTDLRLQERQIYAEDGTLTETLDVFFTLPVILGVKAQVYWREQGLDGWDAVGSPVEHGYVSIAGEVRTPDVTYEVSVVSVSANGTRKSPDSGVIASITTVGVTRQPDKVAGFRVARTAVGLIFSWEALDPIRNFDLDLYEVRLGEQWETAVSIGKTRDVQLESTIVAKGTQTFLIKAVNKAGRESAQAAAVIFVVGGRIGENIVITRAEQPSWAGNKQSFTINGSNLELDTTSDIVGWRARADVQRGGIGLRPGGFGQEFRSTGSYTTDAFQVTSGNAARMLVSVNLLIDQIDVTSYWTAAGVGDKSWVSDFGKTRSWAAAPAGRVRTRVEMRFSTATSAEADFGAWQERPANLEVLVKWAQARIIVEVLDPAFTVRVRTFELVFDVPDVVDSGSITTSAVGTVAVTYTKTYNNAPKLTIQVIGGNAGDTVKTNTPTTTGFNVEVFDSTQTRQARTVNWHTVGF